jgi:hypothetical protein
MIGKTLVVGRGAEELRLCWHVIGEDPEPHTGARIRLRRHRSCKGRHIA